MVSSVRVQKTEKYSAYGARFTLRDLRDLVEQTKHLTDHASVSITVHAGDRPWESSAYTIAVSSTEREH